MVLNFAKLMTFIRVSSQIKFYWHLIIFAVLVTIVYTKATHFMYNLIPEQQTVSTTVSVHLGCSPYKSD